MGFGSGFGVNFTASTRFSGGGSLQKPSFDVNPEYGNGDFSLDGTEEDIQIYLTNSANAPLGVTLSFSDNILEAADFDSGTAASPSFVVPPTGGGANTQRTVTLRRGSGAPSSGNPSLDCLVRFTLADGSTSPFTQQITVHASLSLDGVLSSYGADHLYTFDETATKYTDSAGSNTLQVAVGTPTHDATDGILPTTLGKMSFNNAVLEQSSGVRLDRTTDFTVWMVIRPTTLRENRNVTFGNPTTAELPFRLQCTSSPYQLAIMPRTVSYWASYTSGKFVGLSQDRVVALAVRYTVSNDTISVRHAQTGVAAANKDISSWTTVSSNVKPTAGATVQLRFGGDQFFGSTFEWFSFAVFEDTALSDSQVDTLFSTIGI